MLVLFSSPSLCVDFPPVMFMGQVQSEAGCVELPLCFHCVEITLFQIMTGNSILKDGRSVVEVYGVDLDKLKEGERIGVMRTSEVMDCNF